jgi:hypothetical protein
MGCNFSQLTGEASDESDSRNDVIFFPDAKARLPPRSRAPSPCCVARAGPPLRAMSWWWVHAHSTAHNARS